MTQLGRVLSTEPTPTPRGGLGAALLRDLGPAWRHLCGTPAPALEPTPAVLDEIRRSVQRAVNRITRDIHDTAEEPETEPEDAGT